MALKTTVKVSGITNLSDARYCAGMGVEMLGFDIRPGSTDYVDPLKFQEITGWVAGVKLVGEVHGLSEEEIRSQLVKYPLDVLEVSDPGLLKSLGNIGLPIILASKISEAQPETVLKAAGHPAVQFVLLELDQPAQPEKLEELAAKTPVLLGYELDQASIEEIMDATSVKGFVLKGSQELKPGFKDYDELADILEALETED